MQMRTARCTVTCVEDYTDKISAKKFKCLIFIRYEANKMQMFNFK